MEVTKLTFQADEQNLVKTGGVDVFASDTVSYIEATFTLGTNWQGYDSVRAMWKFGSDVIATVLDYQGKCIVPWEVLTKRGELKVNLVGSISENDVLTDRLTTFPILALVISKIAQVEGDNSTPPTASEYEQFVEDVKADADRAEDARDDAESAESNASQSAEDADIARINAESAQNSAEIAQGKAEDAQEEAERLVAQIQDLSAQGVQLLPSETAYASYNAQTGILTIGIPQGVQGEQGEQGDKGDKGDTGATGATGATGNGIAPNGIQKTGTSGLVDTYTITYTDGTTTTFNVTNGSSGVDAEAKAILTLDDNIDLPYTIKESGYVTWSSGAIASSTNFDATDYIDISAYESILYKRSKSTSGNASTGMAFYDANRVYLFGVQSALNQAEIGYESTLYSVVVPYKAKYARFSVYKDTSTYGVFNAYGKSKISADSDFFAVVPNIYPGYYSSAGAVRSQTADKEVYTEKLLCFDGIKYTFGVHYKTSAKAMVAMINEWSKDGSFSRTTIENRTLRSASFVYIPNSNISQVSFSYRTYDDADFAVRANIGVYDFYKAVEGIADDERVKIVYPFSTHSVKGVNHRGYSTVAPENTLPAYQLSVENGFFFLETDVRFTSDNVPVLLHDATVDRTSNGTGAISDMTFAQARQLDFGSWKGEAYTGTQIMSFEEFIRFCRNTEVYPYVELSGDEFTSEQIDIIYSIVKKYNMEYAVTWLAFTPQISNMQKIVALNKASRIGVLPYTLTESVITEALALKTGHNEVFIDMDFEQVDDTAVSLCENAGLPLEVWTIATTEQALNLPDYVSGATSNSINFENVVKNAALGIA